MTDAEIRAAQLLLNGYNHSLQTDGVLGGETRSAISQFCQAQGVALTWDSALLEALRKHLETETTHRLIDVRAFIGKARGVAYLGNGHLLAATDAGVLAHIATEPPFTTRWTDADQIGTWGSIYRMDISPDGQHIALVSVEGEVHLVAGDLSESRQYRLDSPVAYWARFSPTGRLAASYGGDTIWLWDPATREPTTLSCPNLVTNLAWGPGDALFLSSDAQLWVSLLDGTVERTIELDGPDVIRWLEVSPDGKYLALRRRDPQVQILDTQTLEVCATIDTAYGADASALAFAPKGTILAIGCWDGIVQLVDIVANKTLTSWRAHEERVTDLAFSLDGLRLATCSKDCSVKQWHVHEGAVRSIPVLDSDMQHGADSLGIMRDVRALARVMLARDLHPPLSIGIFGDWGTGKTFFIDKLREQIADDASAAERAEAQERECAWYGHVQQITFNAWHFVETDLWAALVTHLFDELGKLVDKQEDAEQTRRRLMAQLATTQAAEKAAQQRKQAADRQREEARGELQRVSAELTRTRESESNLRTSDLLQLVANRHRSKSKNQTSELQKNLGELKAAGKALKELEPSILALQKLWSQEVERVQTWTGRLSLYVRTQLPALSIGAVVLVILALIVWFLFKDELTTKITALTSTLATFAVWARSALRVARTNIDGVIAGLNAARERADGLEGELDEAQAPRIKAALSPLEAARAAAQEAVAAAQARYDAAVRQVAESEKRVEEAERAVHEASTGRTLFRYLSDRAQTDDYRQHLGIVSLIRTDLERLSTLVRASQRDEKGAGKDYPHIDRIVLYIDDLDRCPPERVVEVLQAVHLLLGIPELFVIVVAVDSRWLVRSLKEHYRRLLQIQSDGDDPIRVSTPLNYLEKIFQIPYIVPSMDRVGFTNMVRQLLPVELSTDLSTDWPIGLPTGQADSQGRREPAANRPDASSAGQHGATQPASQSAVSASIRVAQAKNLTPPVLSVQRQEREFITELSALIGTPRLAKAFINLYRLLRARLEYPIADEPSLTLYLASGEYRVALLMLALQVGCPQQGRAFVCALDNELSGNRSDASNLDALLGNPSASVRQDIDSAVLDCLKDLRARDLIPNDIRPFVTWANRVERFSFQPWQE